MAPPDLDRFFDERRTSQFTAQQVFTNRVDELCAFDLSLERLRRTVAAMATFPPSDPRSNVLTYYGLGGIGKTALSHKLQERFLANKSSATRITARVSFDRAEYIGLEDVLLALRASFGTAHSHWNAFDLGLQVYWNRKYPGTPIQQFVADRSGLSGLATAVNVGQQVATTCEQLLFAGMPVATSVKNLTTAVIPAVKRKLQKKELFSNFPPFAEIVSTDEPDDMLPYLPALLGWDLHARQRKDRHEAVVFLDSFESVQGRRGAAARMEGQLARLAYLMPNALFVITGRNRLGWGDGTTERSTIHYCGPTCWTGLGPGASDEPRQHRVGRLSPTDAASYLDSRLLLEGRPAITADIAAAIIEHSEGLPLYLDLSVQHFDSIVSQGRLPHPDEFRKAFPEIVVRLLRDLPSEERNLTRSAAMLGVFDRDLLARLHPSYGSACLDFFFDRSFVEATGGPVLNHSIHPRLQDSILEHDHETTDYWSAEDRGRYASAALDILSARLDGAIGSPADVDTAELLDSFALAARLVLHAGVVPDWMFDIAYSLRVLWRSHALHFPMSIRGAPPALGAYALVCAGMAYRSEERYDESEAALRQALSTGALTPYGEAFCQNRLGKTLEEGGQPEKASTLLAQGAAIDGPFATTAQKDLARFTLFRGDGEPAKQWAEQHRSSPTAVRRHQALDLLGWVEFINGNFGAAAAHFDATYHDHDANYVAVQAHVALRHLALARSWESHSGSTALADEAYLRNEDLNVVVGMGQCQVARAVAMIGHRPLPDVLGHLDIAHDLFTQKDRAARWLVHLGRLTAAVAHDESALAVRAAQDLLGHISTHKLLFQFSDLARLHYLPGGQPADIAKSVDLSVPGVVANWTATMLAKHEMVKSRVP